MEIGTDQAEAAAALVPAGWNVIVHDDLAAWPRVVEMARGAT
jgi:hypothetical protein